MSGVHHIGRRPILAGIGAAALVTSFDAPLVRAQALDRPPRVLIFDVAESLLDLRVLRPLYQRIFLATAPWLPHLGYHRSSGARVGSRAD